MSTSTPRRTGGRKRLALVGLSIGGLLAGFLVGELVLRAMGFHFQYVPRVQFGWPDPKTLAEHYEPDADLLWVTRGYAEKLSRARRAPPAVVFMGDSCTEFGGYPEKTIEILKTERPRLAGGLNAGVGGWSSQQGVWQLERDVAPLHPKIIVVYYGWNDHWNALGAPDAKARPGRISFWFSQWSRWGQLIARIRASRGAHVGSGLARVDLDQYRKNLETLVGEGRRSGALVVLLTAASTQRPGHEPLYLKERWIDDLSTLVPLHRAYQRATRDAAAATNAVLCDVAAALEREPRAADYMTANGIHFNDQGTTWLARVVADCLERAVPE
ncbi:MAG TPA: SGNH/GDSL hydrolase family protein [Polyangia bacterium]|nr:SGNH/GDSL hydrolase family protein [Polyangia bacterium]